MTATATPRTKRQKKAAAGPYGNVGKAVDVLDERLGFAKGGRTFMDKIFPDHWSFMLGEIALYSFVVLLLTGARGQLLHAHHVARGVLPPAGAQQRVVPAAAAGRARAEVLRFAAQQRCVERAAGASGSQIGEAVYQARVAVVQAKLFIEPDQAGNP